MSVYLFNQSKRPEFCRIKQRIVLWCWAGWFNLIDIPQGWYRGLSSLQAFWFLQTMEELQVAVKVGGWWQHEIIVQTRASSLTDKFFTETEILFYPQTQRWRLVSGKFASVAFLTFLLMKIFADFLTISLEMILAGEIYQYQLKQERPVGPATMNVVALETL